MSEEISIPPAILVQHLVKRFGEVVAVDDLSFTVPRGRCVALLGANGAGKTTTIAMMMGLVTPTSGSLRLLGHDMTTDRFAALAKMNFTSPYVDLPHRLTVRENLEVYARLYNIPQPAGRVAEMLATFDLEALRDRRSGALSAGQKTRLGLAKALINRPELLLLDEPTASLDPDTADRLRGTLEDYRKQSGATILLASHNMAEVERLCDEVLMMKTGRLMDRGAPAELALRYGRDTLENAFLAIARGEEAISC
jgi:ABC-2 type transport system ATP-binding protein